MQIKKNKRSEVSIVIPNYNGEEFLTKNLPHVSRFFGGGQYRGENSERKIDCTFKQ